MKKIIWPLLVPWVDTNIFISRRKHCLQKWTTFFIIAKLLTFSKFLQKEKTVKFDQCYLG
jgi:hypothetical protein